MFLWLDFVHPRLNNVVKMYRITQHRGQTSLISKAYDYRIFVDISRFVEKIDTFDYA